MDIDQIDQWFSDVTQAPPSQAELAAYMCAHMGVKHHWWNKREVRAIYVGAGAVLEVRAMVVRGEAQVQKLRGMLDQLRQAAEGKLAESARMRQGAIQHALDAQTIAVVTKHRLAVAEEVARALAAGGGPRLDKALAAFKELEARVS